MSMTFTDRHEIGEYLAEQASGGVIVEIGCGTGYSTLALHRGTSRGAHLPLFCIDPYAPYTARTGGTYGAETLDEFKTNTACLDVTLIQQSGVDARAGWDKPVALLWIDTGMEYDDLRAIFDVWQDTVIVGGVIAITGLSYTHLLGTARVTKEALASGAYDDGLPGQSLVAVMVKRMELKASEIMKVHAQWREPDYYFRGRPWFVHEAILYLEEILEPGMVAFEWGSGSSTLWLAVDLQAEIVISMEHNKEWFEQTGSELTRHGVANCELNLSALGAGGDYEACILNYPDSHFDLVIVDGRNRAACIANAAPKVKSDGILVLDNSEREQYQAAIVEHLAGWERRDFVSQGGGYKGWTTSVWRKP